MHHIRCTPSMHWGMACLKFWCSMQMGLHEKKKEVLDIESSTMESWNEGDDLSPSLGTSCGTQYMKPVHVFYHQTMLPMILQGSEYLQC